MTSAPRTRSLFAQMALAIFALFVLLCAWEVFRADRAEVDEVRDAAIASLRQDMTLLQTTLDFALAEGKFEQVDRELTARGSAPDVESLVLLDEGGAVIGSRLRHEVGLRVEQVLDVLPPDDMMAAAREHRIGSVRLAPDGRHVIGTFPVDLPSAEIGARRTGVLVAVHDLDSALAIGRERVRRQAVELAVASLVGTGFVLLIGYVVVGRRVRTLVGATERVAAGDLDTRVAIGGADELARIGAAFDAMVASVAEAQRRATASEARVRSLVEAAPFGILLTDADGRVVEDNAAWREIAGPGRREWAEAIHPDDRARVVEEWTEAAREGRHALAECRVVRADGEVVWVRAMGVPEPAAAGNVPGFLTGVVDLTERRREDEARARLEARLAQAQKLEAVGTLASGVAHDFNNILAAVLGYAELLERLVAGQKAPEQYAKRLHRAAEQGQRLVKQILAFGRPGLQSVREVDVNELMEEAARLLGPSLPANVQLVVRVAADVRPILGDPDQLQRVVLNLGTNGWQAMAERGGVLEIGARGADVDAEMAAKLPGLRAGSAVEVWVRDEGCGMDAETRARIYEPFFSTKYGEGTGLGLPVVHGIVRAHGGGITVDTEPGKGTLFRVYLPAAPVVAAHPPPKPVAPPTPGRHVLYVDDDEDLVELAEIAFRRVGYRVTACSRARLALDVFRKDPGVFDLVVTDQRMPEMLGEDLIPALHAVRPDVPVVLMSGDVSPADEARIRARGAEAVVEKPRTMDALVRLCHDVLSRREAVADA